MGLFWPESGERSNVHFSLQSHQVYGIRLWHLWRSIRQFFKYLLNVRHASLDFKSFNVFFSVIIIGLLLCV